MTIDGRWDTFDVGGNNIVMAFRAHAIGENYDATVWDTGRWRLETALYLEGRCLGDFIARLQELQALTQSRFGEDWGE